LKHGFIGHDKNKLLTRATRDDLCAIQMVREVLFSYQNHAFVHRWEW
jgi:hypothetical protein